jgi:hypothetical protein
VAGRKPFLLRIDAELLTALRRWADDELRSLNGQVEFLLRRSLREAGRLKPDDNRAPGDSRRRPPGEAPDRTARGGT